ncbi:DUF6705 family protein [Psychroserpens sp. XS_ASV72]|uniref:DUF6705 family protein n=1 Tax=Psychroserpens sp. XS_ASV72 TaxID=3241293 RepID=UPI0035124742
MKYIFRISILVFTIYSCKAQTPVLSLKNPGIYQDGAYYKDLDNELDKYVGTWVHQNGNTELVLSFIKKEQTFNGSWYKDSLLGEYKYIENGTEIMNFLPRLTDPNVNDGQHYVRFSSFYKKMEHPSCEDCSVTERRLQMHFRDPAPDRKHFSNYIILRHIVENGVEKIVAYLTGPQGSYSIADGQPFDIRVPSGYYTLMRQ